MAATGLSGNFMSGRISYHLGLEGPSVAIDTACSSSLVSVHLARLTYQNSDIRFAISAGVNLMLSPVTTAAISQLRALSSDGRCKTFDTAANGYCRSEGVCVIILGDDCEDRIAYVSGTSSNQDGISSALTVPNGKSQIDLINRVLRSTDLTGITQHSFSTHGTGTALGDPIEVHSTVKAMEGRSMYATFHAIKSDVGHSEGAAGALGLNDSILRIQKLRIPPNKHLRYLNPYISEVMTIGFVPSEKGYKGLSFPRQHMNVSGTLSTTTASFGMSGTNSSALIKQRDIMGYSQEKTRSRFILRRQKFWPFAQVPLFCLSARHWPKGNKKCLEFAYQIRSPRISELQEMVPRGIPDTSFGILLALVFEAIPSCLLQSMLTSNAPLIHTMTMNKPLNDQTTEISLYIESSGRIALVEHGEKRLEGYATGKINNGTRGCQGGFTESKALLELSNHYQFSITMAQIRPRSKHDGWESLNLLKSGLDLNNLIRTENHRSIVYKFPTLAQMARHSNFKDFQICTGANSSNELFYLAEDDRKGIKESKVWKGQPLRTGWLPLNLLHREQILTHQNFLLVRSQVNNDRFKLDPDVDSSCLDSAWMSSWSDLSEKSELCFSSTLHFHAMLLYSQSHSINFICLNKRETVDFGVDRMHYSILSELYLAAVAYSNFKVCVLNIDSDIMDIQLHRFSPEMPIFTMLRSLSLTFFVEHRERHLPTLEIISLRKKSVMSIRASTLLKLHSCKGEFFVGLLNNKTYVYRLLSTRWRGKKICSNLLPRGTFAIGANVSLH